MAHPVTTPGEYSRYQIVTTMWKIALKPMIHCKVMAPSGQIESADAVDASHDVQTKITTRIM